MITDVLWRLAEAYGILICMGMGLAMGLLVIATVVWKREIRSKELTLGLGSIMLLGLSLWIGYDLRNARRNTTDANVSEWLTRLTYQSNQLHRKISESTCQPKADAASSSPYEQTLLKDSDDVSVLARAVKEAVAPLGSRPSTEE